MTTVTAAVLRSTTEGLRVETLEGEAPRAGEVRGARDGKARP